MNAILFSSLFSVEVTLKALAKRGHSRVKV
jgi:hypothetical protein